MPYTRLVLPNGRRRATRMARALRAIWRDSSALWREFHIPITVFLLVTLGGGWLYGELYFLARGQEIALIDRPYLMLQLMILETPEPAPPEWYLILFWYLLPPIAALIIGRGALDFVRLFFNRGERRAAWEEAVASTYRNHVIILGVGHVGLRVARTLNDMGFEVVGIDIKAKPEIEVELSKLGIPLIIEDGRSPVALEKAGLRYAQSFIACTANDHTNLEAIMRARDLNPNIRIVARMWDDQFSNQLKRFMDVQAVLSASDLAAPAFAGSAVGVEITQTVHVNGVDYSLIRLTVAPGAFMDGVTVGTLQTQNHMDIVLHGRDGSTEVQPARETVVRASDTLVIFARHDQILDVVNRNRSR
ncbi:MAG: TrkA family potassium uptake protein [Chloroflexi bacterium]|nr:TrkA family potassium uptake protein [Chloroflexota bacterium]